MKPTIKPKRTAEQRAEEEAVRRQHAANPVRQRPAGSINRQSFAAILSLMGRFKAVRESQGLTLAEVAERMGIDAPALSRLETGKMLNPTLATLHKWAEALGQKLDIDLSSGLMSTEEERYKEVLAHFGAAACRVSSLETNLTNVLLLSARLGGKAPTANDLDKIEDEYQKKKYTLGAFIRDAKAAVAVPDMTERVMNDAVRLRNYLMHNFFRDKAFEFSTEAGRKRMVGELQKTEAKVLTADRMMTDLGMKLAEHLGITLEDVNKEAERLRQEARKSEQSDG
jgi:transcriptional regulator with XRE-family HTH domain